MKLTHIPNEELFELFKQVSNQATITPFTKIEFKKYDAKNVKSLRSFHKTIGLYIDCIQELRSRGFTLLEIMEIIK
jgi:hypothetical protein